MSKSTRKNSSHLRLMILVITIAVISVVIAISALIQPSSALTNGGSITALNSPLTENFDSLAQTLTNIAWADNSTLPGWYSSRTTYNAGTGSSNAGALYSFGVSGTNTVADRALGSVGSNGTGTVYWGVRLTNNTGVTITSLDISYVGEQWRNGGFSSPATSSLPQTVDFQYQIANPGVITGINTPSTGWVDHDPLDFTSPVFGASTAVALDGNAPANRITKSATVTVSISNGQQIWLRWQDINHPDNDHGLAIDDFSVTAHGAGSTNPTGVGLANPSTVQAGSSALLTVTVTPGSSPTSTGLAVVGDLTSIGGSATQQFFDNGTNGDVTAGDNIFSFQATVSGGTTAGGKTIPTTISDAQLRTGSANISLTVTPLSTPPTGAGSANPNSVLPGNSSLLTVTVTPGTNPTSTGLGVVGNLSSIGGFVSQQFFDNGTNGDVTSGDNIFSFQATVSSGTSSGGKSLPITVSDGQSRSSNTSISLTVQSPPPPTTIKISQVYGGGGNSGSTYTNDFIEIYNQGPTTIDISNWSVQYNSATLTGTWQVTNLCPVASTCTVAPGHYYLVKEAQGAAGTTPLPASDAVGTINMSGTSAKVALVASTVGLTGCPSGGAIADLVGYGPGANCSEATPTAQNLSATTAAVRKGNGCQDTDNNGNDFVTVGHIPRNSLSPANSCGGDPTQPSGLGIATPGSLLPDANALLTVKVTPATAPPSTDLTVSADLTSIGGLASQQFFDDGTHGDTFAGDNTFSFLQTVAVTATTGVKSMVATITDAQARTVTAPITLTVESPTCGVERWSVKVGTDQDVSLVALNNPVPTTIQALGAMAAPPDPPGPPNNMRVQPTEATVYVVNATMTVYKLEDDVDYHVVLNDGLGHTMIAEIPYPACVVAPNPSGPGRIVVPSPLDQGIANSRAKFDARFTATGFFQTANIPVRVKGVGFFDFIHGQTGVAPNGIELHPVLDIDFLSVSTTTLVSSANPSFYGQSIDITATVANGTATTPTGLVTFFDGATNIGTSNLNASGTATISTNALSVGPHSITASYEGDNTSTPSTSAVLSQTVNKADQTINFAPLPNKTFGDPDFSVSATATSNLPVSFSIFSGPATIAGDIVHITGAGMVTVRASQAGDGNYNAAPDVDQSFEVTRADQTIVFGALAGKTYGDAPFTVSATGGGSGHPVTFSASGNCTSGGINGSTITITGGGSCTVTASQAGDSNYNSAPDVPRSFTINQATALISVNGYAGNYDGNAHGATGSAAGVGGEDLNGLLSLGLSFINVPGGTAHWVFAGNSNYNSAAGDVAIVITKATPVFSNLSAPIIDGNTASTTLSGRLSLGALVPTGSIAITLNGVTQNAPIHPDGSFHSIFDTAALLPTGSPYPVSFNYAGDGNFNPASGGSMLTIKTPRQVKQEVLAAVVALRAAATDKKDQDKLDDAITHLTKAIDLQNWSDDSHPTDKDGEKVFNEEKNVVKDLAELIKNKKSLNPTDAALMDLIDRLVQVDRELALISISEQTDPKKIAKGLDEIARGDAERDNDKPGHADNAIDHYKNAWKKS